MRTNIQEIKWRKLISVVSREWVVCNCCLRNCPLREEVNVLRGVNTSHIVSLATYVYYIVLFSESYI